MGALAAAVSLPLSVAGATAGQAASGPVAVPAAGQAYLGAFTPSGPYDPAAMDAFATAAGRRPAVQMWFQGWAGPGSAFDPAAMNAVVSRGSTPMITWEPWDYTKGLSQPTFSLAAIASGQHDAHIRSWASAATTWGQPMLLRFAHEMNTPFYPWSEQVNGNQPGDYVRAWRHVREIFTQVGATNVSWAWVPSLSYQGTTPLAGLYPGAGYVDWVGVDGYNGGTVLPWGGWLTFNQLFGPTLDQLTALAPGKPQMIGEVASVESTTSTPSKAGWITDMYTQLAARPNVRAFVWFHQNKEADWRITSSSSAQTAFSQGAANPRIISATTGPPDPTPPGVLLAPAQSVSTGIAQLGGTFNDSGTVSMSRLSGAESTTVSLRSDEGKTVRLVVMDPSGTVLLTRTGQSYLTETVKIPAGRHTVIASGQPGALLLLTDQSAGA